MFYHRICNDNNNYKLLLKSNDDDKLNLVENLVARNGFDFNFLVQWEPLIHFQAAHH